jgi:DNA-directed RNA polymerase specialized sigma24 family protein
MLQMGNSQAYAVVISPLRKLRRRGPNKGLVYTRVEKTTAKLGELLQLSEKERIKRCAIVDKSDAGYIPTECVLHLVRSFRKDQANPAFEALYKILYARLLRRLPRPEKEHSTALTAEAIRDHALDRFRKWLSADLQEYEERLDFFEVRFDMAMKKLRANAEASVLDKAKKQEPLTYADDGQVTEEVEKAAAKAFAEGTFYFDSGSEAFRFALDEVIDTLSSDEGRVIHMLRLGMQIDSKDPDQPTISKALGKSEKTIRNIRDRAFEKVRNALSAKGYK